MAREGPEVVLVRHGETEWSRNGRHTGSTDLPLTEAGVRQAERAGTALAGRSFARVLTSPLSRARETGRLAGLGDGALLRDDLREWDYGDYEGLTTAEIRRDRPGWDLWRDGCLGGEVASQVGARVDRVIAEAREAAGDVALFAHGHVLRVLGASWLGLPPQRGGSLGLTTGTISVLGQERENAVIWVWNADAGAG